MLKDVFLIEATELELDVKDKNDLFEKMAQILVENSRVCNKGKFIEALNYRESQGVTGMGNGLAIPHGLDSSVTQPTVIFCRLNKSIEYESLDDGEVDKVFMIAVPNNSGDEHLKIIATLARKMMNKDFVECLDTIESKNELLKYL